MNTLVEPCKTHGHIQWDCDSCKRREVIGTSMSVPGANDTPLSRAARATMSLAYLDMRDATWMLAAYEREYREQMTRLDAQYYIVSHGDREMLMEYATERLHRESGKWPTIGDVVAYVAVMMGADRFDD